MMATKDISDVEVLCAYADAAKLRDGRVARAPIVWPEDLLMQRTGQPEKVCFSAMERAYRRDLIDYGVSLHAGFLTDKGRALLDLRGMKRWKD